MHRFFSFSDSETLGVIAKVAKGAKSPWVSLTLKGFAKVSLCLAVINITVPAGAMTLLAANPKGQKDIKPIVPARPFETTPLTVQEMRQMQGRIGENPYLAGQNKWDVVYKGINLMSGNYSNSATDLTFEGGYGIPVNVTRSYSSNSADEGPLGKGWNLSVDIRSTAGGLLKSSSAPVRSVPVSFKERNSAQLNDPNAQMVNGTAAQPVEAIVATDAGGKEETEQKDVDGVVTTPPWDKNTNNAVYEYVVVGGNKYQILVANDVVTPDGTTYHYTKQGSYSSGLTSLTGTGSAEPSNVLKIETATDRQGNVTTYHYGTGTVSFTKANGATSEHPLTSIDMPNGHTITFTWGNGTNAPTNRIRTASDGVRTVTYGFTSGLLTSVTTPAGKVTSYGYGSAVTPYGWPGDTATNLLTTITDARGLTATMTYVMGGQAVQPYGVTQYAPICERIVQPNGIHFYFAGASNGLMDSDWPNGLGDAETSLTQHWQEWAGSASSGGTKLNEGRCIMGGSSSSFTIRMYDDVGIAWGAGSVSEAGGWTLYTKTYDARTQDLLEVTQYNRPYRYTTLTDGRKLLFSTDKGTKTNVTSEYNFMGKPLIQTTREYVEGSSSYTQTRSATVEYAYWGENKYFQQKAIRDQAGRYNFTDYYDSSASAGSRGQTYRIYDQKRVGSSGWGSDSGASVPSGTPSGDVWKYNLIPSDPSKYCAQFGYDSKGRPIDAWKIQKTTTTPWTYVQTHFVYGADSSPTWGAPTSVVEDYGSGKINRTTQTLAYDSMGRVTRIQDAIGREFLTNYDLDGVVESIYRVDGTHNDPIITYTYGSSGLLNGAVTQIVDGLSGVTQSFTYQSSSGGGLGQVASVTETNGSTSYEVDYTYNAACDRETATYATPNGTTRLKYSDYVSVGDPSAPERVFQTLNKLDSSGNPTSEEFHYAYDVFGKIRCAVFAQTPQSGQSGYSTSYPAATRGRAYYVYGAADRVASVEHYWDTYGSSTYSSSPLLGNACSYEFSGANRGLKTQSDFYVNSGGSWTLDHSELFAYDSDVDYLTSASYDGGSTTTTWSYDAAGNRSDATAVDNLNRATTVNGTTRTYDILGNTLAIGSSKSMTWDVLNRMLSCTSGSTTTNYAYRSDGMRVSKSDGASVTAFSYDGQMPIETAETTSSATTVTRNGLGARGIDWIERVGTSTTIGYPLYDVHGNSVATLIKSGSSFTISDQRSYDVWGSVRSGSTSGDPKGRYCANLGHVQDDESNLIYMRARYYDSSSGRFMSSDPSMDGSNWYIYCRNLPNNLGDFNGKSAEWLKEIQQKLATLIKQYSVLGMAAGAAMMAGGIAILLEPSPYVKGPAGAWVVGGLILAAVSFFIYENNYAAAGLVIAAALYIKDKYFSNPLLVAGITAFGEIGLMVLGLSMGVQEDDADAWVWGL